MEYQMNAVYGHNLDDDTNAHPDNQKRGFIIYGEQKAILDLMEKAYEYVLSSSLKSLTKTLLNKKFLK